MFVFCLCFCFCMIFGKVWELWFYLVYLQLRIDEFMVESNVFKECLMVELFLFDVFVVGSFIGSDCLNFNEGVFQVFEVCSFLFRVGFKMIIIF